MFGYVRPEKPELLVRDFTAYKSIYCGLCKALGRRSGLLSRLSVSYDMTFLALVLLALSEDEPAVGEEGCILNPLKKKAVAGDHPAIDYAADMTVVLAYLSALDDIADEHPVRGRAVRGALARPFRAARARHADLVATIEDALDVLADVQTTSWEAAAGAFGAVLRAVMEGGVDRALDGDDFLKTMLGTAGEALGRWVYTIDAVDDLERDRTSGVANPLGAMTASERATRVAAALEDDEATVDRHLALLPYVRFGPLVYNIVVLGMPATRRRVWAGEALPDV